MRRLAGIALVIAALSVACSGGSSPPAPPVPTVNFDHATLRIGEGAGARTIPVDVATTAQQSERGLGYRDSLDADAGMLFDLGETREQQIWMKGMRFALDLVWIDDARRVVGVAPGVEPQPGATDAELRRYSSPSAVRYVLELNAGAAARLGLLPGTILSFSLP